MKTTDVGKELGRLWNVIKDNEEKTSKYKKEAEEDKVRYLKEMETYVRPSDEELLERKKGKRKPSAKKVGGTPSTPVEVGDKPKVAQSDAPSRAVLAGKARTPVVESSGDDVKEVKPKEKKQIKKTVELKSNKVNVNKKTAFDFYVDENKDNFKELNPKLSSKKLLDKMKTTWDNMEDDEKEYFVDLEQEA
jgi:hypothetical protein